MDKLQHIQDLHDYIDYELVGENNVEPFLKDNYISSSIMFSMNIDIDSIEGNVSDTDLEYMQNGFIEGMCSIGEEEDTIFISIGGETLSNYNCVIIHNIFSDNIKERVESILSKFKSEVDSGKLHNNGALISYENHEYNLWTDSNLSTDLYLKHINEIKPVLNKIKEEHKDKNCLYSFINMHTSGDLIIIALADILSDYSLVKTEVCRIQK